MMKTDATATAGTDMAVVGIWSVSQDTDWRGIIAATTTATISKTWFTWWLLLL